MERQKPQPFESLCVAVILGLTAVFYLAGMDGNHRWWGDFSLYMGHAKNIAELQPYGDTGYVPNPYRPWLSPQFYPPVYPFLLAPVVKVFGLNLFAAKLLNLGLFLSALWLFYCYLSTRLTQPVSRIGTTLLLAISPWFWNMKNLILSDVPFVFFTIAAVLVANKTAKLDKGGRHYWLLSIVLGITCYLAYGTRSLGLALPVSILLYDVFFFRKIRSGTLAAVVVFLGLFGLQKSYLDVNSTYVHVMVNHAERTVNEAEVASPVVKLAKSLLNSTLLHLKKYPMVLQEYWDNGSSLLLRVAMGLFSALLALIGYTTLLRKKPLPSEIFVFVYCSMLMVVPFFQGNRYLLPVIPFFILYMFHGIEELATIIPKRLYSIPAIAILVFGVASHAGYYIQSGPSPAKYGVLDPESVELYDYIKNNTPDDSLIIFKRPRILALFTHRRSAAYSGDLTICQSWKNFQQLGATYLLINTGGQQIEYQNLLNLISEQTNKLEMVFENADFKFYRFSGNLLSGCAP